jgi:hypothetical protein
VGGRQLSGDRLEFGVREHPMARGAGRFRPVCFAGFELM